MAEKVICEKTGGVGILRLNHPKTMNALDDGLFRELSLGTRQLCEDPDVGAIVLTGAERAFCAGGDLKRLGEGFSTVEGHRYMRGFHGWVREFWSADKPTIAAVNGFAVGAGFCIALLADMVVAAENAKFGMAFVNVGLIPDLAGLYTLPRLVGMQRAKELVFTGRNLSAAEALEWGIVNQVTEPGKLEETALALAARLAGGPRVALAMAKRLMNQSADMPLEQLLEQEAAAQGICFQTEDHKAALGAFAKKEAPVFTGR